MNTSPIRGITGLLDGILSPVSQVPTTPQRAIRPRNIAPTRRTPSASTQASSVTVRRGRPPGKTTVVCLKEKVTLRSTGSLIAFYRDWTWEARCQLSQLVERALADYRQSRRRGL